MRVLQRLVLLILVASVLFALLNPWLATFAVAGVAVGWSVRNLPRHLAAMPGRVRVAWQRVASPRAARAGVVAVVLAATVAGLLLALVPREKTEMLSFSIVALARENSYPLQVSASYKAVATLDTHPQSFMVREYLEIPRDSLQMYKEIFLYNRVPSRTPDPAIVLGERLRAEGWNDARFEGGTLKLSRARRSERLHFTRFTRRRTLALPIPNDLAKGDVGVIMASVNFDVPKHFVIATSPPASPQTMAGGNEEWHVTADPDLSQEMQVELAGPLFRNVATASLLGLSGTGGIKWGMLVVFAVFEDELKKLIARILGKLRHRHPSGTVPASAPPPPAEP